MNPQDAVDLSREAIKTCLMVGGPILAASLLIGLLVGVFQAMTQVQDQTVSFVPKILLLIVAIGLCLPWLTDHMLDFAKYSFEKPMTHWSGERQTTFATSDKLATNQQMPPSQKSASIASRPSPPMMNASYGSDNAPQTNWTNPTPAISAPTNTIGIRPPLDQENSIPNSVQPETTIPTMPNAVNPLNRTPKTGSPFLLPQYRQRPNFSPPQTDING